MLLYEACEQQKKGAVPHIFDNNIIMEDEKFVNNT